MATNDREYLVGMIVGGISNEFSQEIIKGAINAIPKGSNVKMVILPGELMREGFMGDDVMHYYNLYNSTYNMGSLGNLDGLIIAMGSMGWQYQRSELLDFLKQFDGIKTVLIASDFEGYTNVNYDNRSGISETIDCLVNMYGCTNIGMIGGYERNMDSERRRMIFKKCLEENYLEFDENLYVASDMSVNSEEAARKLLDNNPEIQAVFCVNDASAVGLYNVLEERGLRAGRDIYVFGFDNTYMAAEMTPTLSSIGAESVTLGQKAMEVVLAKINGQKVDSVKIPTRLYGRESLRYDKYDYSLSDLSFMNRELIDMMFEDCFYRYSNSYINDEDVNIKRLFSEIIGRMFAGLRRRYVGIEEFETISKMIDIFFDNGALEYTDVWRFLTSVTRLQNGINKKQHLVENVYINRLFLRMKDDAIRSLSKMRIDEQNEKIQFRSRLRQFLIKNMNDNFSCKDSVNEIMKALTIFNVNNAALYMFEKPMSDKEVLARKYPDHMLLKGVIREGEFFRISEGKQNRKLQDIYIQRVNKSSNVAFISFPLFYNDIFFGFLICELTDDIYEKGDLIANVTSMAINKAYNNASAE